MSAQPEALPIRLADRLTDGIIMGHDWPNTSDELLRVQAAAELRRLHAENKAAHAVGIRQERELMECEALLRQALELLEDNREDEARVETTYMHKCYDPVLHAIKRHLVEKE